MFTDEQARDLLHSAADTIGLPPNAAPLVPPRRAWPLAAVAASVVLVLVGGVAGFQIARGGDDASPVTSKQDPTRSVRVGSVVLASLPDGWSATIQEGSDIAAHSCLGPASQQCAVHLLAAPTPSRDSGIDWFSLLTEPCISNASTTVLTADTSFPAGPGTTANLRCAGPDGEVLNTAWTLDAGAAVIPSAATYVGQGLRIMDSLRFADGTPVLPPPAISQEPSAQ